MSSLRWKELKAGMVVYYRERKLDGTSSVRRVTLAKRATNTGLAIAVYMRVWGARLGTQLNCYHSIPFNKPVDWSAHTGWYYRTHAQAVASAQGEAAHLNAALAAYKRGVAANSTHEDVLTAVAVKYRFTEDYLRDVIDRRANDALMAERHRVDEISVEIEKQLSKLEPIAQKHECDALCEKHAITQEQYFEALDRRVERMKRLSALNMKSEYKFDPLSQHRPGERHYHVRETELKVGGHGMVETIKH